MIIVAFLLLLAVFDLFVGVSNDAVNFINSAVGAKAAGFRTVIIVASLGVAMGALMSSGMMDVARNGVIHPSQFTFLQVMTIFLAVMCTDVIILDLFNTLGMPTSTTVSLVFELLGGAFTLSLFKMHGDPSLSFETLLNSNKALEMITAIFVSVAVAFIIGLIVMWLTRLAFTFNYKRTEKYCIAIFGGIAFTVMAYFIFIKGFSKSPWLAAETKEYIKGNTPMLMGIIFVATLILSEILYLLRVNVFKVIVLLGTFALAMAFAGNDLVNFIGVPLAGLSSFQDWSAAGRPDINGFMMVTLEESAKSPFLYLLGAGIIMIIAMATSKKAQNVVKTSVDLSRQDEGDEMFGSSSAARSIIRLTRDSGQILGRGVPRSASQWVNSRFNREEAILAEGAAFDLVRAAINLVIASMLIVIGTNYKLPLSTTYVTFMVAMGSSLADRAWSRDSAVFRVTGVLSVIGGWLLTAAIAFFACSIVTSLMHLGGFVVMFIFIAIVFFLLVRSNIAFKHRSSEDARDQTYQLMLRTRDPQLVWELLQKHVTETQTTAMKFALEQFNKTLDGLRDERMRPLRQVKHDLSKEQEHMKRIRRREFIVMRRIPKAIATERNTWFHLGANSNQQFVYSLKRMLEPIYEHVDNNFQPLEQGPMNEFTPMRNKINELCQASCMMIETGDYSQYDAILQEADDCKNKLSTVRKHFIDKMHGENDSDTYKASLVHLNILQESQEFLSIMRHHLRAARKFLESPAK